jgi:osmoprotectant transport system ATP-binding protein
MATKRAAKPTIVFEGARKEYPDGTVAVEGLDLEVRTGEVLCLVGPSGCGKSTTLRMVNRLVEPSAGSISVNGEDVMSQDPVSLRRHIGYVIQHVGLFPHRTVSQNVGTVPGLVGWENERIAARVEELLELVGLPGETYGARYPHELSGGERQRVGVARALATEPPVLLMDEPFGAVDPQGRRRLQQEFQMIQRKLGTTVVMVTHDIREAAVLADRMVVLSDGAAIEQIGTPDEVLGKPANAFVKDFVADFDVPVA